MKSKQCLSIEQMNHLKELGVDTSNASMCWLKDLTKEIAEGKEIDMSTGWNLDFNNPEFYEYEWMEGVPTFTLQDILDFLPATVDDDYRLYIDKGLVLWTVGYVDAVSEEIYEDFRKRDLIDAAYEMLCWCIENGYITTNNHQ